MTEPRHVTDILRDISVLYELSLSVGQSIELDENCDAFLRTLMARKSLDFASVWIRDAFTEEGTDDAADLTQVYANPLFRAPVRRLAADHPLVGRANETPAFSVTYGDSDFDEVVTETGIDRGAYAIFRLGELGFLKLYSITRTTPFPRIELSKLRHVVEKFEVSLEGCLDHSRVRAAEQRRRELELQMLHAQKLESLGLLAGGVAHDFNNLLTVILGNAEMIGARADSQAQWSIDNIVGAATRAADLCSQLLAYSGRGHFVIEPLNLNAAAVEMLRLLDVTVSKNTVIEQALSTALPSVEGDPTQIRQVVMNLLTNASEALGDAGGTLRIATGTVDVGDDELSTFELGDETSPGRHVYLDVKDTGCGMDGDSLAKLFDPFFTTKFTGRGLGLAAVIGILRSHHAAIRVTSRPNEGTEVRVLFPISENAVHARTEEHTPDERPVSGRVLVVDDEEPVRRLIARVLTRIGLDVVSATHGDEALQLYAENPDLDLVILDLTMPVMGGEEVFRRIVEEYPNARIILTSGYSEMEAITRWEGRKPTAFLAKPFHTNDLIALVRMVLREPVTETADRHF